MRLLSGALALSSPLLLTLATGCGGSSTPAAPARVVATISLDKNPVAVAVNSTTNLIYVANRGDAIHPSSVTVIDGSTNSVTATVTVGPNPCTIAANSVTNKIYVADDTNSMTVIDGANNSTQSISVPGGDSLCALAVDTEINKIYWLDGGTPVVTVIDGATNNMSVVPIPVRNDGDSPSHLAVNTATHDVYVSNTSRGGNSDVTVINGTTLQTSTVSLHGAAFSDYETAVNPRTNTIYVNGGEILAIIDGQNLSSQPITIGNAQGVIAVNAATNRIYFRSKGLSGSQDSVTVMDGSTLGTTIVPTGQNPVSILVDEIEEQIYVVNEESGTVTVIDGISNATTTLTSGNDPGSSALNPTTHRVYVTSFCSDLPCANGTLTVIEGPN